MCMYLFVADFEKQYRQICATFKRKKGTTYQEKEREIQWKCSPLHTLISCAVLQQHTQVSLLYTHIGAPEYIIQRKLFTPNLHYDRSFTLPQRYVVSSSILLPPAVPFSLAFSYHLLHFFSFLLPTSLSLSPSPLQLAHTKLLLFLLFLLFLDYDFRPTLLFRFHFFVNRTFAQAFRL